MKTTAWIAFTLTLAVAQTIVAAEAVSKSQLACAAIYFPALPPGTTAGDYQLGVYV